MKVWGKSPDKFDEPGYHVKWRLLVLLSVGFLQYHQYHCIIFLDSKIDGPLVGDTVSDKMNWYVGKGRSSLIRIDKNGKTPIRQFSGILLLIDHPRPGI